MPTTPEGHATQVTLTLPDDTAERLRFDAGRRGLPPETVALQLLQQHLPREADEARKRAELRTLLQKWQEEDAAGDNDGLADGDEVLAALAQSRGEDYVAPATGVESAREVARP